MNSLASSVAFGIKQPRPFDESFECAIKIAHVHYEFTRQRQVHNFFLQPPAYFWNSINSPLLPNN